MYNRKHITALTSLIMAAALLTGCQENPEPLNGAAVSNENLASAPELNDNISADNSAVDNSAMTAIADEAAPLSAVAPDPSKIIIDCELPDNVPAQVPLLKTGLKKFTAGVPEKLFLDDAGLVLDEDYYVYEHKQESCCEEEHHVYCDMASRLLLMSYSDGDISNYDREGNHQYLSIRSGFDCYKLGNYFNDTELEGFTAEDAISKGNELLAQLGITNAGAPEVCAISADKANAYCGAHKWENKDGTPAKVDTWTSDDEVYFLTYPLEFNGIPVSAHCVNRDSRDYGDDSFMWSNGSYIEMTVRRDRIATIQGYRVFDGAEVTGTADITVSPRQALDTLIEHYNNSDFTEMFDTTPVTVNSCSLVYIDKFDPDTNEFTLRPVWQFGLEWKHNTVNCSEFYRDFYTNIANTSVEFDYVDAVTGKAHFDAFD